MSDKKENKIKLTLRQIGTLQNNDELEYEVLDTTSAKFACKEIFSRKETLKLCEDHEVMIVYSEQDNRIAGFRNFIV